jgi:hypothetical protein
LINQFMNADIDEQYIPIYTFLSMRLYDHIPSDKTIIKSFIRP